MILGQGEAAEVEAQVESIRKRLDYQSLANLALWTLTFLLLSVALAYLLLRRGGASPLWSIGAPMAFGLLCASVAIAVIRRVQQPRRSEAAHLGDRAAGLQGRLATYVGLCSNEKEDPLLFPLLVKQLYRKRDAWLPQQVSPYRIPRAALAVLMSLLILGATVMFSPEPVARTFASEEESIRDRKSVEPAEMIARVDRGSAQGAKGDRIPAAGESKASLGGRPDGGPEGESKEAGGDRRRDKRGEKSSDDRPSFDGQLSTTPRSSGRDGLPLSAGSEAQRSPAPSSQSRTGEGQAAPRPGSKLGTPLPRQPGGGRNPKARPEKGSAKNERSALSGDARAKQQKPKLGRGKKSSRSGEGRGEEQQAKGLPSGKGSDPKGLMEQGNAFSEQGLASSEKQPPAPFKLVLTSFLNPGAEEGDEPPDPKGDTRDGLLTDWQPTVLNQWQRPDDALRKGTIPEEYKDLLRRVYRPSAVR